MGKKNIKVKLFRKKDILGCTVSEYCASVDRQIKDYELIGLREDKFGCKGNTIFDIFRKSIPSYVEVVVDYREYGISDSNICSSSSVISAYGTGLALREDLENKIKNKNIKK